MREEQARVAAPAQTAAPQPAPQPQAQAPVAASPYDYTPGYPGRYAPGYPPSYAPGYAPSPVSQVAFLTPTGGQRLGLAIASLALMIPLFAIATNLMTVLMPFVAGGVAITIGLIAAALVCLTVLGVNLFFNWDVIGHKR